MGLFTYFIAQFSHAHYCILFIPHAHQIPLLQRINTSVHCVALAFDL